MGLDGISVNQLRITQENNSAEQNRLAKTSVEREFKIVDGLSEGQKVDPDKEKEHDNPELLKQYVEIEEDVENDEEILEETIKYDLSRNDKYILKVEDDTNSILIIEKETNKTVQKIDANQLSKMVSYLAYSQGSIINRKF